MTAFYRGTGVRPTNSHYVATLWSHSCLKIVPKLYQTVGAIPKLKGGQLGMIGMSILSTRAMQID